MGSLEGSSVEDTLAKVAKSIWQTLKSNPEPSERHISYLESGIIGSKWCILYIKKENQCYCKVCLGCVCLETVQMHFFNQRTKCLNKHLGLALDTFAWRANTFDLIFRAKTSWRSFLISFLLEIRTHWCWSLCRWVFFAALWYFYCIALWAHPPLSETCTLSCQALSHLEQVRANRAAV